MPLPLGQKSPGLLYENVKFKIYIIIVLHFISICRKCVSHCKEKSRVRFIREARNSQKYYHGKRDGMRFMWKTKI